MNNKTKQTIAIIIGCILGTAFIVFSVCAILFLTGHLGNHKDPLVPQYLMGEENGYDGEEYHLTVVHESNKRRFAVTFTPKAGYETTEFSFTFVLDYTDTSLVDIVLGDSETDYNIAFPDKSGQNVSTSYDKTFVGEKTYYISYGPIYFDAMLSDEKEAIINGKYTLIVNGLTFRSSQGE